MMEKFYITTSIVYTNASPHIGFAFELIQADVIARYKRIRGYDVWFLTGTDEHGSKIEQKAKSLDRKTQDFCDEVVDEYKKLTRDLNISNDDLIRTTDQERHWVGVTNLWDKMVVAGDIYEKEYEGLYCVGCESFIKEKELVDGKCIYHHKMPEKINEKNWFFRLSKYTDKIEENIKNNTLKIIPESKKKEMISFISRGLEDISFSRPKNKVGWGIPVPNDSSQLIYVWGDALVNYISAIGYGKDNIQFEKYWPADIHFIGKDILKFHSIIWQGMLLSAGLPLPKNIFTHGFLTIDGQKISKSLGNVINPFDLIREYGADAVRYYFLREISPTADGDFSHNKFKERYNSDLASGLGNLLSRVLTMSEKSKIGNRGLSVTTNDINVLLEIEKTRERYDNLLEEFKFNEALVSIWELIAFSDRYIEIEKPWDNKTEELGIKNKKVIFDLLIVLDNIADLLGPFMPKTSVEIKRQLVEGKGDSLFKRKNS